MGRTVSEAPVAAKMVERAFPRRAARATPRHPSWRLPARTHDPAVNDVDTLKSDLKVLIVRELNLEGRDPTTIDDDAPLFGEGLGLDSLDALQLAMAVEEQLGVRIPEGPEGRVAFASVSALARWIVDHRSETNGAPGTDTTG
jgi:acyl carrier protein